MLPNITHQIHPRRPCLPVGRDQAWNVGRYDSMDTEQERMFKRRGFNAVQSFEDFGVNWEGLWYVC